MPDPARWLWPLTAVAVLTAAQLVIVAGGIAVVIAAVVAVLTLTAR